ncbi:GNAT family N-acetyltransferase [Shewanella sp. NIFS-20-20]|uniref:GNAT family N-acetyltransferase n=1 Tax=Shewanella sp. NIFS-20-20 TaxID=2853806 RepID=UPI001C437C1E|nr:GNAT family protein [Shewanella sp. NIFS-20-20]MBV7317103.1 GNAT family N-acetyltransferase [Shewanella sp. NIFS-20-20]
MGKDKLTGDDVVLEPLSLSHKAALYLHLKSCQRPLWFSCMPENTDFDTWFAQSLSHDAQLLAYHWVVRSRHQGDILGCVAISRWDHHNLRARLALDWLAVGADYEIAQQACVLLIQDAFERFNAMVVEFACLWHNQQVRALAVGIGAHQDGVLRNHQILADGTVHDQVVYSILDSEWPTLVQKYQQHRLA